MTTATPRTLAAGDDRKQPPDVPQVNRLTTNATGPPWVPITTPQAQRSSQARAIDTATGREPDNLDTFPLR